jgi:hypothetical protein
MSLNPPPSGVGITGFALNECFVKGMSIIKALKYSALIIKQGLSNNYL